MASLKLIAGNVNRISFQFYNEQGKLIVSLTNPVARLYSTLTGELITTIPLTYNPSNLSFEANFSPSENLNGTYYFIATGVDENGILRKTIQFVDILPVSANYLLLNYDQVIKFINDTSIDYSILPSLILTATEWVQDKVGKVILSTTIQEKLKLSGEFIYLTKYPVLQVLELKNALNNEPITNFEIVNKDSGVIKIQNNTDVIPYGLALTEVSIKYIAGYNPIPETFYTAIGMIVGYMYDRVKYQNFDRIRMLGVEGVLAKDVLDKILELLTPYIKVS